MTYQVDTHSDVPASRQLVDAVLDAITRGELGAGARLPSVRKMAGLALVNPNTVGKAYRELEHLGVALGRNGSGVFVTDEGPELAIARRADETLAAFRTAVRIALRAGHEDAQLVAELGQIMAEETKAADAAMTGKS